MAVRTSMVTLALVAIGAFALACDETITPTPATADAAVPAVSGVVDASGLTPMPDGTALYGKYCGFCHGDHGQGYVNDQAPALANEEFLAIASDDYLRRSIANGRPGTVMSAWGRAMGGPLEAADVDAIVAHVRTWQKRPFESVDARVVTGDVTRGLTLYGNQCQECHGANGHGGKHVALGGAELLAVASDGFLATTIEKGRPSTPMQAFASVLTPQDVGDVVTLLRSWQKPVEDYLPLPPGPGELGTVVLNPGGPEPSFDPTADFIPADTVKAELDRGATMVIADARAPSDYARLHIAGAIDVPFYNVEPFTPQIPKERFIVTYCACPHAESSQSRNALRALGYRSSAIDEGIFAWRDRGYPVRGGPNP